MTTAFCVQAPRGKSHDLSSANRYGNIVTILSATDNPSLNPGACMHKMNKALKDFGPDDVIFMAGGDYLSLAFGLLILYQQGFKEVKYLRWERERDIEGNRKVGHGFYVQDILRLTV
jgi:hypothetical protein